MQGVAVYKNREVCGVNFGIAGDFFYSFIAKFAGSTLASPAILFICSSVKVSAFCFSSGVIIATAFLNCSNSAPLGAAKLTAAAHILKLTSYHFSVVTVGKAGDFVKVLLD
jgi:hypothetical protein